MRVLWYSVLRLLVFLVPFALLMLMPYFRELPWLAALFAALIGVSLSVIFLRTGREELARSLAARRARRASSDEDVEDAALDQHAAQQRELGERETRAAAPNRPGDER